MSGPISRRGLVQAGAAVLSAVSLPAATLALASALPASAVLATPSTPTQDDARPSSLAASLMAEFKQLAHEENTATERLDRAYEAVDYPDAPDELFWRESDVATLRGHVCDVDCETKRRWWGEDARIARLRADDYSRYSSRRASTRRDEIVATWDGWQATRMAAEDRCGYTAAHAEWLTASDRYEAFRLRLIHMATTDRDIMAVKAAVVEERYSDTGANYLDLAIARHLEEQDDLEALCFSIVRDYALRFRTVA